MTQPSVEGNESRWLLELAASFPFGRGDRIGTANHLDAAARRRAAEATRGAGVISLARPLVDAPSARRDGKPAMSVEVFVRGTDVAAMGSDHVELDCHGLANTHLDALNHVGVGGHWYGGYRQDDPAAPSVVDLAPAGLVARAVLVDIPAVRGTPWAEAGEPVTGADIEAALSASGTEFLAGDALLLYMGRDRFEAAGHAYRMAQPSPGLGEDGAHWIADHAVSILCWDFLDVPKASLPVSTAHSLVWAIGQILVDNCDFGALVDAVGPGGGVVGTVVVAPLALPGGTGCNVNPLVLR